MTNSQFEGIIDNPDIVLCPYPAYDIPNLNSHGYGNGAEYAMGVIDNNLVGWTGNISTDNGTMIQQILDDISTLKEIILINLILRLIN